jgi:hypothetical protein
MTLPASGPLSIQQINAEFGRGNDLNSYRGTTWYTDAGGSGTFPTGAISIGDFFGKRANSPSFSFTISSHIDQANLRTLAVNAGWNQSSPVTATLASGYYLYSSNVGAAALTIDGSWPGGVTFVNNGYVMGMGGTGGGHGYQSAPTATTYVNSGQTVGGPAIILGVSCTIQNNSYIAGGGGGGGSCVSGFGTGAGYGGGGGAGGGSGGTSFLLNNGAYTWYYGGGGGGLGGSGAGSGSQGGGGGGRILPGSNITQTASNAYGGYSTSTGGGGGNPGSATTVFVSNTTASGGMAAGLGGSGGGTGSVYNGSGQYSSYADAAGGGGGWGASGGTGIRNNAVSGTGASGGKCVHLNGYSVSWAATGTRYGAIS